MMPVFRDLGDKLEESFAAVDYNERAFPDLATRALEEARLSTRVNHLEVTRWLVESRSLPTQDDIGAAFGQPPVTVYRGRRFYVQVLLWREGTTAIHRHGFSGAFTLLEGESLHTRYRFVETKRVNSSFLLGHLSLEDARVLGPSDVLPIHHHLAHALFHLDAPSATVVARTYREPDTLPQWNYHPPCLAIDPFHEDPATRRQLQALSFVRETNAKAYAPLAAELARRSDVQTSYQVLLQAHRGTLSREHAPLVTSAARERHGEVVDVLLGAIHEELRDKQVGQLRARVKDKDAGFFLSLLQNLRERDVIFALLEQRFPNAPAADTIRALLEKIPDVKSLGADLADEPTRLVVHALVDGADEKSLLERFVAAYGADEARREEAAIKRHAARLKKTALGPILALRTDR